MNMTKLLVGFGLSMSLVAFANDYQGGGNENKKFDACMEKVEANALQICNKALQANCEGALHFSGGGRRNGAGIYVNVGFSNPVGKYVHTVIDGYQGCNIKSADFKTPTE